MYKINKHTNTPKNEWKKINIYIYIYTHIPEV